VIESLLCSSDTLGVVFSDFCSCVFLLLSPTGTLLEIGGSLSFMPVLDEGSCLSDRVLRLMSPVIETNVISQLPFTTIILLHVQRKSIVENAETTSK
jgi:hypothetical protein